MKRKVDNFFMLLIFTLTFVGFFIFFSASLGLLARDSINLSSVMFSQIFFGIFLGFILMFVASKINYLNYRKYSFYIFLSSLLLSALVFSPLGIEHGGATRWLSIFGFSFQPAEFLKLGFIIYFSAWLASTKKLIHKIKYGVIPMLILLGLVGVILLNQPDTGTFLVIFVTALSMLFVSGARWKHLFAVLGLALAGFGSMAYMRPYIWERVSVFLNPTSDVLGAGYQLKQSLIAVGSGQWLGRGFGKSIQKFNYLPEPIGDSIFAVIAEEWGFIGSVLLILLFILFVSRGLRIASQSSNNFGKILTVGIIVSIISQSFINIASMLGVFPLTGMPLLFVSQGGTALMFVLLEVGIVLNISKYRKKFR